MNDGSAPLEFATILESDGSPWKFQERTEKATLPELSILSSHSITLPLVQSDKSQGGWGQRLQRPKRHPCHRWARDHHYLPCCTWRANPPPLRLL